MAELETRLPDELREQQRAVSAVLRAVASGGGLQPVLDEVVAASARLCRANTGSLYVLEGTLLHAVSRVGGDFATWEYDQAHPHELDPTTVVGRAAIARAPAHIPDVLEDPDYTYGGPRTGYRSLLGVPIVFEDELIGGMTLTRAEPEPFSEEEIDLVQTFADQAAVALKNARLLETVERQLSQQRAVGAVMRSVARSRGLQAVLDDIVESAMTLSGVQNGRLYLLEDGVLRAVANSGNAENFEYDRQHPHTIDRSTLTGRAALTREPVHIPDILEDPEYTYTGEGSDLPYRSGVTVPILLDDELIGALGNVSEQPGAFTQDHVELLQTFADQAAIAIANARLIDAVERQLDQQQAISDVLQAIALSESLEAVFEAVVAAATRLCHADFGALYLRDGDLFSLSTRHEWAPALDEFEREHPHVIDRTSAVGRVALTRDVVHIHDVAEDPEYEWGGRDVSEYHAVLAAPVIVEDALIGALDVTRREPGPFTEEEVRLIRTFADQAAIAIANARLIETTNRQLEQQRSIADVLAVVARAEGLEAVFEVVLKTAGRLCAAEYGQICLADGDVFRVMSTYGTSSELAEYERAHPTPRGRETAVGRVGVTRDVVHIPDVLEDVDYSWGAGDLHVYRAMLAVPIFIENQLIGVINVVRDKPGPFSAEQIELVKTFADQAAIAIANARLIDAVRRQLEQQKAISEVLGVVARAEGLDSVLHAVVEAACRLCAAQFGEVHLIEGDLLRLAVGHGGPAELYEYTREHPDPAVGSRDTVNGRVLLLGDVVHVPDILEDAEYSFPAANEAGVRALLGAPLLVEGELVGVFNVVRTEAAPFTGDQIELLRTFADQAAIAVANARLMEAVERQLEQQRAISDVLSVVARSEGLDSVFHEVVEAATRLCEGEYGGLYILEDGVFHARSHFGMAEQFEYEKEHPHAADRKTLVGRVALTHDVVHIPNLVEDPEYDWPLLLGHHAGLGVPILVEGELMGAIAVTRKPEPFTPEEVDLVGTFADQAAIAISNARLMEAVERQRSELSRFVSPQVAELVTSEDGEKLLAGHRAYVTSMFCDLRGFTSFTELAEPEELFEVLQEYHAALGELIPRYQGTLEHFAGDGLLVFFNDPLPVDDHELKAIELSLAAQQRFEELAASWRKLGHELGLGVGIAAGYATLGRIGFVGRYDYGVLGTVNNLASRLSSHAEPGQTLISQRVYAAVEERVDAHEVGSLELKGFGRPVPAYEVRGLKA